MSGAPSHTFYEFFAGGGMARLGLGPRWRCLFANDFDPVKAKTYRANFGDQHFSDADVWSLSGRDLPGRADLAWASFPCQDLSLAGRRAGLEGERSGAFFGFWRVMEQLRRARRGPRMLVLENVSGALSSRGGADFIALARVLAEAGWRFGALELDAEAFLPQSRPRLFVVAVRANAEAPEDLARPFDSLDIPPLGCSPSVYAAASRLPEDVAGNWLWWRLPMPEPRTLTLADTIENDVAGDAWHPQDKTDRLLAQMSERHIERVWEALEAKRPAVGALYRRTRMFKGERVVRAEVRFDGLAGCLRTPAGGSSRQFLVFCEDGRVRTRPITPRETARLMGLPDDYVLPDAKTAALTVTGDGLAAPVVRHLAEHVLEPMLAPTNVTAAAA